MANCRVELCSKAALGGCCGCRSDGAVEGSPAEFLGCCCWGGNTSQLSSASTGCVSALQCTWHTLKSGLLLVFLLLRLSSHTDMPLGLARIMALYFTDTWPSSLNSSLLLISLYLFAHYLQCPLDWPFVAMKDQIIVQQAYVYYSTPANEGGLYFSAPRFAFFGQRDIDRLDVSMVWLDSGAPVITMRRTCTE